MPGVKCGACGRYIAAAEGAKCIKCQGQYHRLCAGVGTKVNIPAGWRCPECKKHIARDNRDVTPIRGPSDISQADALLDQAQLYSSTPSNSASGSKVATILAASPTEDTATPPCSTSAFDTTTRELSQIASSDVQLIMAELRTVRAEIQGFRREMEIDISEFKSSIITCISRIDSLEARVDALEQRISTGPANTDAANNIVNDLRRELNERDQDLLSNDIEISNITETKVDNPIHIVKVIGLKLGVNIEERDIVSAERVGGRQLNAASSEGAMEPRPRAIVVRLARRDLRDELLASARVRRGATTADLDIPGTTRRFYLNERLTKANRWLFRKTRDAAGLFEWKFVWTKRGRILARRRPGDVTHRIRSENDISRVFGPVKEAS